MTSKVKSSQRSGVEVKRQLIGKSNLPQTCVANSSVDLDPLTDKTMNSSASTSITVLSPNLYSTQGPAEGIPTPIMSFTALITGPALRALTPPKTGRTNPGSYQPGPIGPSTFPTYGTQANQSSVWS